MEKLGLSGMDVYGNLYWIILEIDEKIFIQLKSDRLTGNLCVDL